MAIVTGRHLKIDPEDDQQGVFFVSPDGTEVHVSRLVRNMPGELIFTIPDSLTAERYTFKIAAKPKNASDLRTGQLDTDLYLP